MSRKGMVAGWRRPLPFEVCEFAKRRSWGMADAQ